MKSIVNSMRTYVWTEFKTYIMVIVVVLSLGTLQIVPNYGILNGELRVIDEKTGELGEYIGGA